MSNQEEQNRKRSSFADMPSGCLDHAERAIESDASGKYGRAA
jgi:hypothetical protein